MAGGDLPTSGSRLASPRSPLVLWGDHLAQGPIARELDCNGRGLGGGIHFLFPGHLPPSSLTQWIGHTSAAAPEQAHPNRYKKHKHPSSSGQAHKGRQGTLGGVGGAWVPAALIQWPRKMLRNSSCASEPWGSHSPFPAQLANILKHKSADSACLGCTPGIGVHVSWS